VCSWEWGENCDFGGQSGVKSQNSKVKFATFWVKLGFLRRERFENDTF
jgi:hypothetical protein